jgi:hypothetical protein
MYPDNILWLCSSNAPMCSPNVDTQAVKYPTTVHRPTTFNSSSVPASLWIIDCPFHLFNHQMCNMLRRAIHGGRVIELFELYCLCLPTIGILNLLNSKEILSLFCWTYGLISVIIYNMSHVVLLTWSEKVWEVWKQPWYCRCSMLILGSPIIPVIIPTVYFLE